MKRLESIEINTARFDTGVTGVILVKKESNSIFSIWQEQGDSRVFSGKTSASSYISAARKFSEA